MPFEGAGISGTFPDLKAPLGNWNSRAFLENATDTSTTHTPTYMNI